MADGECLLLEHPGRRRCMWSESVCGVKGYFCLENDGAIGELGGME